MNVLDSAGGDIDRASVAGTVQDSTGRVSRQRSCWRRVTPNPPHQSPVSDVRAVVRRHHIAPRPSLADITRRRPHTVDQSLADTSPDISSTTTA